MAQQTWEWAVAELFGHALRELNLHPLVIVGEPKVELTEMPNRQASARCVISFEVKRA